MQQQGSKGIDLPSRRARSVEAAGEGCKANWKLSRGEWEIIIWNKKGFGESESTPGENRTKRAAGVQGRLKRRNPSGSFFHSSYPLPGPLPVLCVLCMSVLGSMADISSIIYENMKSYVLISISGYFLSCLLDYASILLVWQLRSTSSIWPIPASPHQRSPNYCVLAA